MKLKITSLRPGDFERYREIVRRLWPDYPPAEIRVQFRKNLKGAAQAAFVCRQGGRLVGFIDVSLRRDYVEGRSTSPTGYIEGIYVDPEWRRRGIARALARRAETWAKARGCPEMGSDTETTNRRSIAFHKKIGYREANRVVCFLRTL